MNSVGERAQHCGAELGDVDRFDEVATQVGQCLRPGNEIRIEITGHQEALHFREVSVAPHQKIEACFPGHQMISQDQIEFLHPQLHVGLRGILRCFDVNKPFQCLLHELRQRSLIVDDEHPRQVGSGIFRGGIGHKRGVVTSAIDCAT